MSLEKLTFVMSEKSLPMVRLPVRTTVLELTNARVLHSPGSGLSLDAVKSLGDVTDIVAPNLGHLGGAKTACQAHPRARLWGPPGAREKIPELTWTGTLGTAAWPYAAELSAHPIAGMATMNEYVFLHAASRSLLVGDLLFNLMNAKGLAAWAIFSLLGTYRRLAVSRLFLKMRTDNAAVAQSLQAIAALSFDNLVPSHGEVVEGGAKQKVLAAFRERGLVS